MDRELQQHLRLSQPGDLEAGAQYFVDLLRVGQIAERDLRFLASIGDEAARRLFPDEEQVSFVSTDYQYGVPQPWVDWQPFLWKVREHFNYDDRILPKISLSFSQICLNLLAPGNPVRMACQFLYDHFRAYVEDDLPYGRIKGGELKSEAEAMLPAEMNACETHVWNALCHALNHGRVQGHSKHTWFGLTDAYDAFVAAHPENGGGDGLDTSVFMSQFSAKFLPHVLEASRDRMDEEDKRQSRLLARLFDNERRQFQQLLAA